MYSRTTPLTATEGGGGGEGGGSEGSGGEGGGGEGGGGEGGGGEGGGGAGITLAASPSPFKTVTSSFSSVISAYDPLLPPVFCYPAPLPLLPLLPLFPLLPPLPLHIFFHFQSPLYFLPPPLLCLFRFCSSSKSGGEGEVCSL